MCNVLVVVILVLFLLVLEVFDVDGLVLFLLCYVVLDGLVGCVVWVEEGG